MEIDIDRSTGITVYLSSFPPRAWHVQCCHQNSQSTQVSSGHAGVPSTTSPGISTEQSHETTTPQCPHIQQAILHGGGYSGMDVVEKMRLQDWKSQWLEKPFVPIAHVGPCRKV